MSKGKLLIGLTIIAALLALQVGAVKAAPLRDGLLPDGTIKSVTLTTDASNNPIVEVVVTDSSNVDHTVDLTIAEALTLGLITDTGGGTFTVNAVIGKSILNGAVSDPCAVSGGENPVAGALTSFFCGGTTLGTDTIDTLHTQGYGYGEIAQACFMAEALGTTCGALLTDKSNHDFSSLGLADVKNWGQLRKHVVEQVLFGKLGNLGSIMSGRAAPPQITSPSVSSTLVPGVNPNVNGNGNGHGHGKGGNGKGHGHGKP